MKLKKEKFGKIQELKYGKALKSSDRKPGDFPVYGSNGIIGYHDTPLVNTSGIVLGRKGSFGKVHFVEEPFWPIDTTYYIESSKEFDLKYLYYLLNSMQLDRVNLHVAVPGLSRKDVYKRRIFYPEDLTDQKRIARVLSDCEQLIAWRKESIQLLDEYLEATFLEMFGDPVRNEKGFSKKSISTLCHVGTGATPSRKKEAIYYGGQFNWIKTTSVNGTRINTSKEKITQKALDDTNCKLFPPNTILIAMYGQGKTRGHVGLLEVEAATNQACAAIVPSDRIKPIFLFYQLKYSYKKLRSLGRGGNQENLNLSLVKSFNVLVPEPKIQERFIEISGKVNTLIALHNSSLNELQGLLKSLSQKAFKGELDLSKVVIKDSSEPTQSSEAVISIKTEKGEKPNLKNAATQQKGKRDIRNLSLLDYYEVPVELYQDQLADDNKPELDFLGYDLFYQFYLKDHFADQSFTFADLQQKFNEYYSTKEQDFDSKKWKIILYKFMEGQKPLVEQIFEEASGTVKLKLTDEAFKA